MAATQEALYRSLDLELSWSEAQLPERERTKHVHRLHPYLGKFIPQLVEVLLQRYVPPGGKVLDPFAGSGTTLVQALESGYDAVGVDIASFNALLMRVKTASYELDALRRDLIGGHDAATEFRARGVYPSVAGDYVRTWYAAQAAEELLNFRGLVDCASHPDVLRVVLARAARSARRTTHFELDFPRAPQEDEYWCHKHRRMCRPVDTARRFLLRYTVDTLDRIETFAAARRPERVATVLHGDARELPLGGPFDAVITSPPYPGLIDYHEQHRYAYELLGLEERRSNELGNPTRGSSRRALGEYVDGVADVLRRSAATLRPGAPLCIVVNDRRGLYGSLLERARLRLVERHERHVNRRTGRRGGEYFESVLVAVSDDPPLHPDR